MTIETGGGNGSRRSVLAVRREGHDDYGVVFLAAIKRGSVSLVRFIFRNHVQVYSSPILSVSRLKYLYHSFSSLSCFLVFVVVLFVFLLPKLFLTNFFYLIAFYLLKTMWECVNKFLFLDKNNYLKPFNDYYQIFILVTIKLYEMGISYYYFFKFLQVYCIRWWPFTGVTASLLKSPGLFLVF